MRFSADFYEVSTPISTLVLLRFYPVSTRTEGPRMRRDAWRRSTKTTRGTSRRVFVPKDAKQGAIHETRRHVLRRGVHGRTEYTARGSVDFGAMFSGAESMPSLAVFLGGFFGVS
jgi:hypothetical protein